jgi:prefoldin subunit 5
LPQDEKDVEKALESIRAKAEKLKEDLEPEEALGVLEEAVAEVEAFGEKLEEAGS